MTNSDIVALAIIALFVVALIKLLWIPIGIVLILVALRNLVKNGRKSG